MFIHNPISQGFRKVVNGTYSASESQNLPTPASMNPPLVTSGVKGHWFLTEGGHET